MKKSGFTLVEIAVVVLIIGLLASLGSLVVVKSVGDSRKKQAQAELEMISAAVLQLAWDTGRWPNGALRTNPGSTEIWDLNGGLLFVNENNYTGWKGPYIDALELDPWGKKKYFFDPDYLIKGVNHVVVGSFGPNKVGQNLYDSDDVYVLLDD